MQENKPQIRSLNGAFNDLAHIRSDAGISSDNTSYDPDAYLSFEQHQTREDLFKISHHNPDEVLAGRIAPLNIEAKKLTTLLRKKKQHFNRLLLHIQLEQLRSGFAEAQERIQDLLDHLREIRLALLEAINGNNNLLEMVETARNCKQFGRTEDGEFINETLQHMVDAYIMENDIPNEKVKDFTLEQMLAMVEEQSEQVILMNVQMSDQICVIDRTEKDLIGLSDKITEKQRILNSDAPEYIKKQVVADFYKDINLEDIVSIVGNVKMNADISKEKTEAIILKEIDKQNIENINNAAQRPTNDPLMNSL